jgi:hypothetical protein
MKLTKLNPLVIAFLAACLAGCASANPPPGPGEATVTSAPASSAEDKAIQFDARNAIATVPPAAEDEPGYWDETVCKREPVTGSRQHSRRCHTRWQWAQMEDAATETMRDIWSKPIPHRD